MTNCYTREFIEDYQPYDELFTLTTLKKTYEETGVDLIKQTKKELKQKGFQVIRSKYYSSLTSYVIRALRYKHGKPSPETLTYMRKWCTIS